MLFVLQLALLDHLHGVRLVGPFLRDQKDFGVKAFADESLHFEVAEVDVY